MGLAVRGTGERDSDVGDILLAQPAQQDLFIIYHFFSKFKKWQIYKVIRLNNIDHHTNFEKRVKNAKRIETHERNIERNQGNQSANQRDESIFLTTAEKNGPRTTQHRNHPKGRAHRRNYRSNTRKAGAVAKPF